MDRDLKLELSPEGAEALVASGLLGGQAREEARHDVHYDTVSGTLDLKGLSLRISGPPDRRVQTLSGPGLSRDTLTPDGQPISDHAVVPLFAVALRRREWLVQTGGATVRVDLDVGEIVAGERRMPVHDLTFRLRSGSPEAVHALVRQADAVAPLRLRVQTKAERGHALIRALPDRIKAEPIDLPPDATGEEAFLRIVRACIRHIRLNETRLCANRSAEALHQTRVGLRRLRSAFSIGKPLIGGHGADLRADLRWLAGELGAARDLDVLLERAEAGPLRDRIRHEREAAHDRVAETLGSDRARRIMLDLAAWLDCGAWRSDPATAEARGAPARDFAAAALQRFRRKVKSDGRHLAALADEDRHEVRKDAKKLRYAADFFTSVFDRPKRQGRFLSALEDLQEHLGALNDLATEPELMARLDLPPAPTKDRRKALLPAAEQAWDDLVGARSYWR